MVNPSPTPSLDLPVYGVVPALAWMNEVMLTFHIRQQEEARKSLAPIMGNIDECVDQIFNILTHRRFTHLSRKMASSYKSVIVKKLRHDVMRGQPLHFFFDLGPGYHASIGPDFSGLRFDPGLGELLALRQIALFTNKVEVVYPPGVKFWIVVDDLCAWVANEIPISQTSYYLEQFRELLASVGVSNFVELFSESAVIDSEVYCQSVMDEPELTGLRHFDPSGIAIENVSRFVGHPCTFDEAVKYISRYARAQIVSERLMAAHLGGVRLMQRASADGFGFRSFPGGDARHQCGEIDLLVSHDARPRPSLTTHRNFARVIRWPMPVEQLPAQWPLKPGVFHIVCARE